MKGNYYRWSPNKNEYWNLIWITDIKILFFIFSLYYLTMKHVVVWMTHQVNFKCGNKWKKTNRFILQERWLCNLNLWGSLDLIKADIEMCLSHNRFNNCLLAGMPFPVLCFISTNFNKRECVLGYFLLI